MFNNTQRHVEPSAVILIYGLKKVIYTEDKFHVIFSIYIRSINKKLFVLVLFSFILQSYESHLKPVMKKLHLKGLAFFINAYNNQRVLLLAKKELKTSHVSYKATD